MVCCLVILSFRVVIVWLSCWVCCFIRVLSWVLVCISFSLVCLWVVMFWVI